MNLLYATTSYNAELLDRVHEEFLQRWLEQGHSATIIVPDPDRARRERWRTETPPSGHPAIPVVRPAVSATWLDRGLNWLSKRLAAYDYFLTFLRAYWLYLRRHPEIDVIHVESVYPLGAVAAVASLLDRRPFVPTIRGGDLIADDEIGYGFARFRSVRWLLKLTFGRAALVRAVSPGAGRMAEAAGCPPAKLATIPRNIRDEYFLDDPAAFRAEQRRWLRERHPEIAGRQVIVAAGRLLPVKGFDDLIKAMAALPDAVALICGPNRQDEKLGDYAAYLTGLASQRGVADRVILPGGVPRAEMARYFAGADVLAVSSLIEGGNRTILEGATLGVPFVATETAGTPEFFTPDQGLAVPPRRPDQLAAGLAMILAEPPAAREARQAACIRGAARFMSANVAREIAAAYARLSS